MKTWWTGGQYSLYRVAFGVYLLIHFAMLLPYASELFSDGGLLPRDASPLLRLFPNIFLILDAPLVVIVIAAVAAVFFAAGLYDRIAAVLTWYVLACLFGRNPLISNPSLPFVGWLLLAHALMPSAPYGSLAARGRIDPRGSWTFPRSIHAAAWIVMALGYSYSGYTKLVSPSWTDGTALARVLANPLARPSGIRDLVLLTPDIAMQIATWGALGLELLYAPLALFRRVRPWLWLAMLAMHLGLIVLIDFADLSLGMVMVHLFTFDPRWVPRRLPQTTEVVLYDGSCALCHGAVRFLLAEDQDGTAFRFSPLLTENPGSVVVETAAGETLTRSDAVIHAMHRIGGLWRVLAYAFAVVPRVVRDAVYDFVARIRYRVFGRAKDACPLMPAELRSRFI